MWVLLVPTCEVSGVQTNNCIVAATAIPATSTPSFPSITSIAESLRYSLCYESACDLVIDLLHCNKFKCIKSHKYPGHSQKPDHVTQRPFSREPDLSFFKNLSTSPDS